MPETHMYVLSMLSKEGEFWKQRTPQAAEVTAFHYVIPEVLTF